MSAESGRERDGIPRDTDAETEGATSTAAMAVGALPRQVRIAIVGTGFAGLGMAIRLKQQGIEDFVVLERGRDVGGTWRDNTYPGCACDVPAHLYSFSFALNPNWSHTYAPQPEIWAYLRDCAERFGVESHIRYGCEVLEAAWDEERQHWQISTAGGPLTARFLIMGNGPLSEPSVPKIPGLERFEGTLYHSAQWNAEHDLSGERVAVIGTGASAIQFVPHIQPRVGNLTLFQRTPPWIVPRRSRASSADQRARYQRYPLLQRLVRAAIYWQHELAVLAFVYRPAMMRSAQRVAQRHLAAQVADPALRAKLTPNYTMGCKRILLSDDFYPALTQPNVEVVTDGIREVRARSIVTNDGVERDVDTILLATGFHVTDMPAARYVFGRGGQSLADAWRDGPRAYLGTTVAGFPNLFFLIGPNTGLGHSSMVYMIESQLTYILDALRGMERRGARSAEVRAETQKAFNEEMRRRMRGTVWVSGCASWYLDAGGYNSTLWPGFSWQFRWRTRRFDAGRYALTARTAVIGAR